MVAVDMASARTPSPLGDTSAPSSPQLTPRSKVRALLATIDDKSSDDESSGPSDPKPLSSAIDKSKNTHHPPRPPTECDNSDNAVEDDEDDEIIRPRGRVAARMHAAFGKTDLPPKSPSRALTGNSPDTRQPSPLVSGNISPRHSPEVEDNDEDEDGDIIAPSRRRQTRRERETTPEKTPQGTRQSTPGLFVSSPAQSPGADSDSDEDDLPVDLSKSVRFKALLEKKRKERREREEEEERQRLERAQRIDAQTSMGPDSDEDDMSDISDDEGGRKLTQDVSRPARKASKKALEEMNRETQRLSRSLQLAHEVKTKKKISKASLFQRFNFRVEGDTGVTQKETTNSSRPTTPSQTDAEVPDNGTPPSSPPLVSKEVTGMSTTTPLVPENETSLHESDDDELLTLEDALAQMRQKNKTQEKADAAASNVSENEKSLPPKRKTLRQVRVKLPATQANSAMVDLDDDLIITDHKAKDKIEAVFARIPEKIAQESREMKILRNLAHLSSPPKEPTRGRNAKPSMTFGELHMSLQQRAKAQAKLERERRLDILRSKGVVVQTAEEREREREQVEDIVAKARQEAEEIMLREREDAKKARKDKKQSGEADPLAWDDSDDDSFEDDRNEDPEDPEELELSGSEDEEEEGGEENVQEGITDEAMAVSEDEAGEAEDKTRPDVQLEDEAEEDSSEKVEATNMTAGDSDEDGEARHRSSTLALRRPKKRAQVISDDEDEEGENVKATPRAKRSFPKSPSAPGSESPKPPTSVLRSATKTFIPGLPVAAAAPAGLGLTQIFAGTMDDSQAGSPGGSPMEFMPSIDQFPDSQFSAVVGQSQDHDVVADSQTTKPEDPRRNESQTQALRLHYTQSQMHGFDSILQENTTQMSEFLEPTQDRGFQDYTPLKQRFIDPTQSTIKTQPLSSVPDVPPTQDSPLVRKKGKLLRRTDLAATSSTSASADMPDSLTPSAEPSAAVEKHVAPDAFSILEKATIRERKSKKKFNKNKSKATEMVEEQAVESEDEYAGLGGADGEDSSDEDDELVKQMIDDTGNNDGDMEKLAGLFADRERKADAAQMDKLFRDITTGMLRKRRRGGDGHDFDLSDSDDGGEARRRLKRQKFAKMQKALFADERIGKIAENPRNAAFLKSIEDTIDNDDWDLGEQFVDPTSTSDDDSQSQNTNQGDGAIPNSQPLAPVAAGRKRSRMDDHASRPGPSERRPKAVVRPSSIAEVRRSLSALLEEPNASVGSVIPATEVGSDDEENEEFERPSTSSSNQENRAPSGRRTNAVVDRIALKRNSSSSISTSSAGGSGRLAFTAPSTAGSGFKVPALLRRATTNSTKLVSSPNVGASPASSSGMVQASATSHSSSLNKAASFGDDGKLKKTASKHSGINYFAHENERRAKVAEAEKRREARKWKDAEGRSKVVGGLFGTGSFE
ncbi:hypothetical protein GGS20DRAFT_431845 [Poronia punctata]|nr:hypothetical protein GGS20DRAFT_431845 [Poronia punctata]